jgi:radical SAM-linked protein
MDGRDLTAHKQALLAEHSRRLRVVVRTHDNTQSHLEAIFARGDRACADLLERAFRLGCRFDGWDDALKVELWEQAIAEERAAAGFDPERYLAGFDSQARLPWDHIDTGVDVDFLRAEHKRALVHHLSPPCGKPVNRLLHPSNVVDATAEGMDKLVCYDCGIDCSLSGMKDQRLFFLRRMNAWAPTQPLPAPVRAAAGSRRSAPQPQTRFAGSVSHRYRLRYTKQGQAAYLAHLDLVRHLPRAFRRAGLDIAYSHGFHPKPGLSFGPALGLGIPSIGELLEVKLSDDISAPELLRLLNAVSLPGIEFLDAVALRESEPAMGKVLARAEYAMLLPEGLSAASACARFASGEPLLASRRERKDSRKTSAAAPSDVRPSLTDVTLASPSLLANVQKRLGWVEASADNVVCFGVVVSAMGSARPVEVVEALYDVNAVGRTCLARLGLWAANKSEAGTVFVDPLAVEARDVAAGANPLAVAR